MVMRSQSDATDAVRESQRARAEYLKRFYGVDAERPEQYDVGLNTDSVEITRAVYLIVEVAQQS
jgi:cytidylate kinase